jgi:hypothetical protein
MIKNQDLCKWTIEILKLKKEEDLRMNTDLLQQTKIIIKPIRKYKTNIKTTKIKKIRIKKLTAMKFRRQFQIHKI